MYCMNNEFKNTGHQDDLHAENDFLKMKLMLERGAQFGSAEGINIPPEIENEFLKNIIEIEQQFDNGKSITVYDKIGKPEHYKPADDIPDGEIENAYEILLEHLAVHGIRLIACSPNVSTKELYRFALEELFGYEMDDMEIEGLVQTFVYDDFHPDDIYENTTAATHECMAYILGKEPMKWMCHFKNQGIQLNRHKDLSKEEFIIIVNLYKQAYDDIEIKEMKESGCIVDGTRSWVTGTYKVIARTGKDSCELSGEWEVGFEKIEALGYWYINNVQVQGLNL